MSSELPPAATPPPRVLLIEQDDAARTALSRALRSAGLTVTEAGSPQAALDRFREADPAVVFLCAELEELPTCPFLATLRDEHPAQAVVVAAHPADHRITDVLDSGVYAFLPKPLNADLLIAVLWAAVRRSRSDETPASTKAWLAAGAPDARREINLVIGILMERYRFTQQAAYRRLRYYARCQRQPLREIARELLTHQERVNQTLGAIASAPSESRVTAAAAATALPTDQSG